VIKALQKDDRIWCERCTFLL